MVTIGQRRMLTYAVGVVVALIAVWVVLARPFGGGPLERSDEVATTRAMDALGPGASATDSPSSAAGRTTTSRSEKSCRMGAPARLVMPALGVDAPFETIGLDQRVQPDAQGRRPLGNPIDRTKAGWYADGPRPGSGQGTVLTNGHTYRDGSAIFKEDFSSRIDKGQLIHIEQDNGSTCSYRVERIWREVDAAVDYPRIVASERLYNFEGPERLFLTTCGGSWNNVTQNYDDISLLIAIPVDRG